MSAGPGETGAERILELWEEPRHLEGDNDLISVAAGGLIPELRGVNSEGRKLFCPLLLLTRSFLLRRWS
jgi:hypothetical protein